MFLFKINSQQGRLKIKVYTATDRYKVIYMNISIWNSTGVRGGGHVTLNKVNWIQDSTLRPEQG